MSLTEKINEQIKDALKNGRKLELETLRTIRAGILEFEKQKVGTNMTVDDEINLLTSAAKKRREAVEQYRNAGREDLAEKEEQELAIILRYLPAQLTTEELRVLVAEAIASTGAAGMKDMGKVMGSVMKTVKGRADGTAVQQLVREMLGGA